MPAFTKLDLLSGGSGHPNSTQLINSEYSHDGIWKHTVEYSDKKRGVFFSKLSEVELRQLEECTLDLHFVGKVVNTPFGRMPCTGSLADAGQYICKDQEGQNRFFNYNTIHTLNVK